VNREVTTFHTIVEGTQYWFAAIPAKSYLLTIFLHLFFVDQVVPLIVMITVLHLSQESRSQTHYIYLKAHNREGEGVRIEKCEEVQI
jgi:hypothetical protein